MRTLTTKMPRARIATARICHVSERPFLTKIPPLRSGPPWLDTPSGRSRSEPRQNTFDRYRSAAKLFRACAFSDSLLELLAHLVARGLEFFPLLRRKDALEFCLLLIVDLAHLEHLSQRTRRAFDDGFHPIGVLKVEVGHRLRLLWR